MKIITIVQARMSSTRFPGKVLKPILGKTLLERMIERMQFSKKCGQIVVALPSNPADDVLEKLCCENNIAVFRGSEDNLLERHYACAVHFGADIVAKIPSDCPLICPNVIDEVFEAFFKGKYDYFSNLHPATYPDGNDVEIFTIAALEKANIEATRKLELEHTTPYFWENPDKFVLGNYSWPTQKNYSMSHRFTIDYPEDYEFIRAVFEGLYPTKKDFRLEDILIFLEKNPKVFELNSMYAGVNWYRNHLDELKTIQENMTKKI